MKLRDAKSGRAHDPDTGQFAVGDNRQSIIQCLLNAGRMRLRLPAVVVRAVVFDANCVTLLSRYFVGQSLNSSRS